MKKRALGSGGLMVSALGLGCMGMSEFYGRGDEKESIATIHRALDLGLDFLDTSDMYGIGRNEELVGKAIRDRRERVILATKFGVLRGEDGSFRGVNGKPKYVRAACEASLRRLGIEVIDLYYQHRVDPEVPVEETVGAMADLVREGKVRFLGLSEAAARTIRRAQAVHPVAALQSEYSLWSRDCEGEVLPVCRELGIGYVAYSPLGRGFFAGRIRVPGDLDEGDRRHHFPRFQGENMAENLALLRRVEELAAGKGCTPAQFAIGWVLARGEDIVPIPGTKQRDRLEENLGALEVAFTREELEEIDAMFPKGAAVGLRYPEEAMRMVDR